MVFLILCIKRKSFNRQGLVDLTFTTQILFTPILLLLVTLGFYDCSPKVESLL